MKRDFGYTSSMESGIAKYLPWRSVWLGGAFAAAFLLLGVPIFLRMPPWADVTLYDVAAANLLRGGAHYRDIFDTNTPGFVWILSLVRAAFGWSYEALRLVDLAIVAGIVLLLNRFAREGGASRAVRMWSLASIAAFYPFLTEACHAQRDVWMLLPALMAVRLRWKVMVIAEVVAPRKVFTSAVCQGLLWAVAVWIKPHVLIPAAIVWLSTWFLAWQRCGWRGLLWDFAGNLLGGTILGAAGFAYLWFSGSWDSFIEVFAFWNPSYADRIFSMSGLRTRARLQDAYFPPWSYLHWAAMPIAFATLLDGYTGILSRRVSPWLWNPASFVGVPPSAALGSQHKEQGRLKAELQRKQRITRLFPAWLYLGWTLQAIGLQREFHYVHVAEIFLILAVIAPQRWAFGFLTILTVLVASLLIALGEFDNKVDRWPGVVIGHDPIVSARHPITTAEEWRKWQRAWRFGLSEEESLTRMWEFSRVNGLDGAPNWVELHEIAEELRKRGAKDGDVIAWNDSPHAVFLLLKTKPGLRYLHVRTFQCIGLEHEKRIYDEAILASKTARFAVSDLQCLWINSRLPYPLLRHTEDTFVVILPKPGLDFGGNGIWFPYERPVIYRSGHGAGRYLIHDLQPGK